MLADPAIRDGIKTYSSCKHLGYAHIPQRFAAKVNAFCQEFLNPYLNFHRPCLFAKETIDAKGKRKKRYPHEAVMTPLEKLASLHQPERFLKPGMTLSRLHSEANSITDNQAAERLNQARTALFQSLNRPLKHAA